MTSLLYLLVIAMWVAIVIPTFLTRHDRRELERSFQKPLTEQLEQRFKWAHREPPTARQRSFHRRRRVMMTLLTWLAITLVLGMTHTISRWWIAIPLALLSAFIAAAARAVSKQQIQPRVRSSAARQAMSAPAARVAQAQNNGSGTLRGWRPHTTPLPSYMTANQAATSPRGYNAQRPWTSVEMLGQAEILRNERNARFQEAQLRLEEARARALEKARLASKSALRANREYLDPRAVNE
ncbi:MAG: hypothetical protein F2839_06280 [Actinobacteria bacterium]|uniref:Unannotated protein n=1 Tax=freshwater metagenome TaxID=449393 RepID=A0A6J5ZM11_9ZZZZ|nr:hypothetical protein [Actinomycetota bacterium]